MDNADNREDLEDLEVGLAHAVVAVLDDRAASATAHRMLPLSTAEHLTSHALQAGEAAAAALTEASVASGMYTLGFRRPFDEHITLSDILGPPDTLEPGEAMQREHCGMADSDMQFIAENYKVDTTSRIEYHFVTEPESGLSKLGLVAWPAEDPSRIQPSRRRQPRQIADLHRIRQELNERLKLMKAQELTSDDAVAGVLYTGPLGQKYQRVIRAAAVGQEPGQGWRLAFLREACCGNTYPTTVGLIHSALHKLSKLTRPGLVYCGISDGVLPPWMRVPDDAGVRGAIEPGFTSATPDVSVAMSYAAPKGMLGTLLEIQMGAFDRGGDMSALSQYPHESEILLPPLAHHDIQYLHVARDNPQQLVVRTRVRLPVPAIKPPLLSEAVLARLCEAISATCGSSNDKFDGDARALVTGNPSEAARGLAHYMRVDETVLRSQLSRGTAAIMDEVAEFGNAELNDCLHYVLHEPCAPKHFANGMRDVGRNGERLADFCAMAPAVSFGLSEAHVCALRLYTTAAFKYLNGPLREQGRTKPHPLPTTVAFIADGIKKLRAKHAEGGSATQVVQLYRGMRNLAISDAFMAERRGGTELAPMSTTSDIGVAASYSLSGASLLFKLKVNNFMQFGADLQWLSAFPGEAEICYPPLTYLQPTGRVERVKLLEGTVTYTVVEVEPHIS